ncbi:nuclease-related domain-containing protein [Bacillus dakarensis]|uniref:nuclease-related domain-containing protein n=1 Tax=Robertmurraya dakarensis TaxID=1926278 RepID=UPI00098117A3|nr:nuclease-related domain-containing protein [Bacillus dakarensis]
MLLKERFESDELLAMRYLNPRMELTEKEKFQYINLEKGYEGEVKFDLLLKDLQEDRYIINDLLLEVNNSQFQIDTLILSQGVIHLLDIKYFKGDYYLKSDKLFSVTTGREYKNPVIQLKRSETLFRQLLQNLKQNYLVDASVIFNHPEFTLYQAPMDLPFILPTQVNRFLEELNKTPSTLNNGHQKLAQKLISLHQTKNRYTVLPEYHYDQLQKGIYCSGCKAFSIEVEGRLGICKACGHKELIENTVIQSVREFKHLFPDRQITTKAIHEWCKAIVSKRRIRRILEKNYKKTGVHQWTYYE